MFSSSRFQHATYFPQINLLRGLAALMVSLFHFINFNGEKGRLFSTDGITHTIGAWGCQGVYIFFVISGFVIPLSMYKGNYKIPLIGRFLLKRSIRIEPPYIASMFVLIGAYAYISHLWGMPYPIDIKKILLHIGYLIPFTFGKYEWYNVLYWTLAIEFQYYILMAFLYPLLSHKKIIWRYSVLLLFLCGPFMITDAAFLPLSMPCFLIGFLLFLNYTGKMKFTEMMIWLAAAGVMNYFYREPSVVVSTSIAFFFIWKIQSNTWIGNSLGNISYSYYLIHGLVGTQFLVYNYDPNATLIAKLGLVAMSTLFSLTAAIVFWFLFERPSKKLSGKIKLQR